MKFKNLMAKALYDNVPESPEELAFRKGDILTVMEQNTGGLEGWWLCSLHGRQGIAPGNRLKLLIGPMFEAPQLQASSGAPTLHRGPIPDPQAGLYQGPVHEPQTRLNQGLHRRELGLDNTPHKVVTPARVGQSFSFTPGPSQQDLYDVPPSRSQGVYDVPPGHVLSSSYPARSCSPVQSLYDVPPSQPEPRGPRGGLGVYDIPPSAQGVYSVPPCRPTSNHQEANYDFPQPLKSLREEGIYDVPPPALTKPTQISASSLSSSHYDYPPSVPELSPCPSWSHGQGIYDMPPLAPGPAPSSDVYDVPRGSAHNNRGIYDIPDAHGTANLADGVNRLSFSSTGSSRSSMSTSSSSAGSRDGATEGPLDLDLDGALRRLLRLQHGMEAAVGSLLATAASPLWRTTAEDARSQLDRVRAAVADLVVFGRGAAANAATLSDGGLNAKLRRQLGRLENSQLILLQTYQALDSGGWDVLQSKTGAARTHRTDNVDRFVMVSRTVPDDGKQLASTVFANAELLFRRPHGEGSPDETQLAPNLPQTDDDGEPSPTTSPQDKDKGDKSHSERCVKSWMEDYDYVHLQGKEDFERQQKELLNKENIIHQNHAQLGPEQIKQFQRLEQEVIKPVENDISQWITQQLPSDQSLSAPSQICPGDKQLLLFYSDQCERHFLALLGAMDAFFSCVGAGQPPRIFVAHSKFVILSAHKLVFIGDALSRQVSAPDLADRVMAASNVLCDLLKVVVGATKGAALSYPNTAAVQEMVDRVTELSQHSQRFKEQLLHLSQ